MKRRNKVPVKNETSGKYIDSVDAMARIKESITTRERQRYICANKHVIENPINRSVHTDAEPPKYINQTNVDFSKIDRGPDRARKRLNFKLRPEISEGVGDGRSTPHKGCGSKFRRNSQAHKKSSNSPNRPHSGSGHGDTKTKFIKKMSTNFINSTAKNNALSKTKVGKDANVEKTDKIPKISDSKVKTQLNLANKFDVKNGSLTISNKKSRVIADKKPLAGSRKNGTKSKSSVYVDLDKDHKMMTTHKPIESNTNKYKKPIFKDMVFKKLDSEEKNNAEQDLSASNGKALRGILKNTKESVNVFSNTATQNSQLYKVTSVNAMRKQKSEQAKVDHKANIENTRANCDICENVTESTSASKCHADPSNLNEEDPTRCKNCDRFSGLKNLLQSLQNMKLDSKDIQYIKDFYRKRDGFDETDDEDSESEYPQGSITYINKDILDSIDDSCLIDSDDSDMYNQRPYQSYMRNRVNLKPEDEQNDVEACRSDVTVIPASTHHINENVWTDSGTSSETSLHDDVSRIHSTVKYVTPTASNMRNRPITPLISYQTLTNKILSSLAGNCCELPPTPANSEVNFGQTLSRAPSRSNIVQGDQRGATNQYNERRRTRFLMEPFEDAINFLDDFEMDDDKELMCTMSDVGPTKDGYKKTHLEVS